ncbi:MAG: hypothetical protein AABY58_11020, partial [Nitrospirota bacterium]
FLKRGGFLAWGIVPTSEAIRKESTDSLFNKMTAGMNQLITTNTFEDILLKQCLITPSCGTGSMQEPDARAVFKILKELGKKFKGD